MPARRGGDCARDAVCLSPRSGPGDVRRNGSARVGEPGVSLERSPAALYLYLLRADARPLGMVLRGLGKRLAAAMAGETPGRVRSTAAQLLPVATEVAVAVAAAVYH